MPICIQDAPHQNVIISYKYFLCNLRLAYVCIIRVLSAQNAVK